MNWDNLGKLRLYATDGNEIAPNEIVAMIMAPGAVSYTATQDRSGTGAPICGGNFTPSAYLDNDTVHNINNADISVGKFILPHQHRDANDNVTLSINDQFIYITRQDIWSALQKRSDFAAQIGLLLDDVHFRLQVETGHVETITIAGTKGTDNLNCAAISNAANQRFCNNWKEMLLLTQLSTPAPITINSASTAACNRVLVFGGQKAAWQARISITDKGNPDNYLEGVNLTSFAIPTASSSDFIGTLNFSAINPSADLLRCLP